MEQVSAKRQRVSEATRPDVEISLTASESELFEMMLGVIKHFNLSTTVRVAGGWVRDKILHKESEDIDIALDDKSGREFASLVTEFLSIHGSSDVHIHMIESNPEQSKHLETARVHVGNRWIDFVNLRKETYAENSRIPTIDIGTPREDALRRDLTVNSLFYNVNHGVVEDFSGMGLADLKDGIIRTPLDPHETFLDDPLRVLRTIRFATRLGFAIEPRTLEMLGNPEILSRFCRSISRERVGVELVLMLHGNSFLRAVDILWQCSLVPVVFSLPPGIVGVESEWIIEHKRKTLDLLEEVLKSPSMKIRTSEEKEILCFCALLFPWKTAQYHGKKKKLFPVVPFVIVESLKRKRLLGDRVQQVLSHIDRACLLEEKESLSRVELGKFLRASGAVSYLVFDLVRAIRQTTTRLRIEIYMESFDLECVWEMRPLINGRDLAALLRMAQSARIGMMLEKLIEWQLKNPLLNEKDAEAWILKGFPDE